MSLIFIFRVFVFSFAMVNLLRVVRLNFVLLFNLMFRSLNLFSCSFYFNVFFLLFEIGFSLFFFFQTLRIGFCLLFIYSYIYMYVCIHTLSWVYRLMGLF